jgi:hypothetical protein
MEWGKAVIAAGYRDRLEGWKEDNLLRSIGRGGEIEPDLSNCEHTFQLWTHISHITFTIQTGLDWAFYNSPQSPHTNGKTSSWTEPYHFISHHLGATVQFSSYNSADYNLGSRPQWSCELRHELYLPAETLRSWIQIQVKACISVSAYSVCVALWLGSSYVMSWSCPQSPIYSVQD